MTAYLPHVEVALRLSEPERNYARHAVVLAAPQLDGTLVRLARSAGDVWRLDVIDRGRPIHTRIGARNIADVRRLVESAQASARERGSEVLVCPRCRLPVSAIKETLALRRSLGSLQHVECPRLFDDDDENGADSGAST